ncbi:MAG: enoyl-CoA hydratase/isomerase family protein [Betaproteobacteria bacterium]|nr:enoyl-CoA hydratase/isomerase family protein [Betaproteobacteria bacterium]
MEYRVINWELRPNPNRPEEKSIGLITFNRPEHLNAVDVRLRVELDILLDEIRHQSHIKAVIITGAGRGFSAGGDLKSEAGPLGAGEEDFDMGNFGPYKELAHYFFNDLRHSVLQRCFRKLEDLAPITIAAINGPAVGIGLELCTLCDLRFASDRAKLGEVAVPAGFLPESGGSRNLPKLVGIGKALEMILTGKIVDAAEAERIGLVDRVIPHDKLLDEAFAFAGQVASAPYLSVRYAKQLVKFYWNQNRTDEGWRRELEAIMEITRTKDCQEGIRAFLEKRKPEFRGPYYDNPPYET